MKDMCVVSGCSILARGNINHATLGIGFQVCGVHRINIVTILNEESLQVSKVIRKAVKEVIVRIDNMGNHDAEKELFLAS